MNDWFGNFRNGDISASWMEILRLRFPTYRHLSEADRSQLNSYISWFIGCKEFEGTGGLSITDEMRVLIAAQACLLLLHRETPCYERLRLIRVHPGADFAKNSAERLFGTSWNHGVVELAWDSVRGGAANPFDGDNVVLHEFAHQLDGEDGGDDGTPLLGRGMTSSEQVGLHAAWARMLSAEYDDLREHLERGHETVMDAYGGKNHVEFFAVATECFFEKPRQLLQKHPRLYAELKKFYRQDPAAWEADSPEAAGASGTLSETGSEC